MLVNRYIDRHGVLVKTISRRSSVSPATRVDFEQAMFTGQADVALKIARQLEDMLKPGDATR